MEPPLHSASNGPFLLPMLVFFTNINLLFILLSFILPVKNIGNGIKTLTFEKSNDNILSGYINKAFKRKTNKMKKIIVGISAMLLLASAAVFANNSSTKKADCCAQGNSCCYPGSPCCNK